MLKNSFFKWIWRINGIGLTISIIAFFYLFYKSEIRRYPYHRGSQKYLVTSIDKKPKKFIERVLRNFDKIEGTAYTLLSLTSVYTEIEDEDIEDYLINNLLFINREKNSVSWLFKENYQFIQSYTVFPNSDLYECEEKEKYNPEFIYYKIIDTDTNGDKKITTKDKESLAVSDISGKNYKIIVKNIDYIMHVDRSEKDCILFIYKKSDVIYSLKFNIKKFEIISNISLPKVSEV